MSICIDHQGGQYIEIRPRCTNVNILRSTVACLNATVNVNAEMQNQRFEQMGLGKPPETSGSMGPGPGLAHQQSLGWVFGWVWN